FVGLERILIVQAKTLEVEVWIAVIKIRQGAEVVPARAPSGENVFAVDESVDVAAEFHVVLAEGIREVVLDLQLAVVVVAGQIEALAKFADAADEDFWRTGEDRLALAGLALNQGADFIDFAAEDGGQGEDAADALVDEVFRISKGVEGFRLAVAACEAFGVVA